MTLWWQVCVFQTFDLCEWLLGGGAIEMELSKYLRDFSRTIAGKEQLIIAAVAKSLEVIPRQLCDNAGFDSTNVLNRLRQAHAQGTIHVHVYCKSRKCSVHYI